MLISDKLQRAAAILLTTLILCPALDSQEANHKYSNATGCRIALSNLSQLGRIGAGPHRDGLWLQVSERKDSEMSIAAQDQIQEIDCRRVRGPGIRGLRDGKLSPRILNAFTGLSDFQVINSDFGNRHISERAKLSGMNSIQLSNTNVDDRGLLLLAGIQTLESVILSDKDWAKEGLAGLERLPRLGTLDLNIDVRDRSHLSVLSRLSALTGLVGEVSYMVKLPGELNLRPTRISAAGIRRIESLDIVALTLPKNMTDEDLRELFEKPLPRALSKLNQLELSDKITDAGITHLMGLENIELLNINDEISEEALLHMYRKRPDLTVYRLPFMD